MQDLFSARRPRRNRHTETIRALHQEVWLQPSHLIAPLFLLEGTRRKEEIPSMPGVFRLSLDQMLKEIEELASLGIGSVNLYPVIPLQYKDERGSYAIHPDSFLLKAIYTIKREFADICIISDVALDPYTNHGHDGWIDDEGRVLNDETVCVLAEMARLHADSGVDMVAPSDMMDGRVGKIRQTLDLHRFHHVGIMAYTAKFASALYRPFREALHSAPRFGDKKSYQMNPANSREALIEAQLDVAEGADSLLIKPALPYLDIIAHIRSSFSLPIVAYQVSGEYAMIMAAAEKGWLDGMQTLYECTLSLKRAGTDSIITYAAKKLALMLRDPLAWQQKQKQVRHSADFIPERVGI